MFIADKKLSNNNSENSPSIIPCGGPRLVAIVSKTSSPVESNCFLRVKNCNFFTTLLDSQPFFLHLFSSKLGKPVSNAVARSREKTQTVSYPLAQK